MLITANVSPKNQSRNHNITCTNPSVLYSYVMHRLRLGSCLCLLRRDTEAEYCDERVCLSLTVPVTLSVCLFVRDDIFGTTRPICTTIFARVTYDRGSVLLWQRSDTLCISGFMDDVIFDHQPRLPDVGALVKRSAHAALGLATN